MNNQTISTGIEPVPPPQPAKFPFLSKISEKIPPRIKELFARFYSNKKIFWPVITTFGFLFLVIIAGLIFGSKAPTKPEATSTPTPLSVEATPEACAESDRLCEIGNQLKDFNKQINALDLKQSRLSPPLINYDIQF